MASISSPLQASLQTINVTATTVARQVISGAGGYGGGGGGGGGSVAPASRGPDPETLAIVKADQSAITSLRGELNSYIKRDNDFISKLPSIIDLEKRLDILSGRIDYLGAQLLPIGQLIQNESFLEQQKDRQEYENERRLAEQGLRAGKEKALERSIQNALMAPIRAIGNRVSSVFGNLMNFMWTLLGGWLTIQGLNVLKALASGDKKTLEEIKNNVIKSLLVVGGILGVMSFGIFRTIGLITKLTFKIGKFVLENTIGKLFGFLGRIGRGALGKAGEVIKDVGKGAGEAFKGFELFSWVPKIGEGLKAIGAVLKGGTELAGKVLGKIVPAVTLGVAVYRFAKGDTVGGILSVLESIPILDIPAFIVDVIRDLGAFKGTALDVPNENGNKQGSKPPPASATSRVSKPQTPAAPPKSSLTAPAKSVNAAISSLPNKGADTKKSDTANASVAANVSPQSSTPPPAPDKPPAQIQSVSTVPVDLGSMKEPKTNVVMLNSNQNQQQSQTPQSSLQSGSATDVPLFASANPDNFYSLYAQVNYNVIL